MRVKIYTTKYWFQENLPYIASRVKLAGVEVDFQVTEIELPRKVPTYSRDGGIFIDWTWLKANVFEPGYDAVCLHITSKESRKLGLQHPDFGMILGGAYNADSDNVFDFMIVADQGNQTPGYPSFDTFTRIFLHELAHGFDHWTHGYANANVHHYDYDLKEIHNIFNLYNYRTMSLTRLLKVALVELIKRLVSKRNV